MRNSPLFLLTLVACDPGKSSSSQDSAADSDAPTWEQDVAPVVAARCGSCHTEGGAAFSLDVYDLAKPMASAMAEAVASGAMPPWGAEETDECKPLLGFKNDLRLTDDEKAMLLAWAEAGAPQGDVLSPAALPTPPNLNLDRVDLEVAPLAPFAASGDDDEFMCFVLDPELTENKYLIGAQVLPGNPEVVHHVLVYTDPAGASLSQADENGQYKCFGGPNLGDTGLIAAWAPGSFPTVTPDGVGMPLTAGTLLVMQVHYHPRGLDAEPDNTRVQIEWAQDRPDKNAVMALNRNSSNKRSGLLSGPNDSDPDRPEFLIPAGVSDHTESMEFTLDSGPYTIFAVGTHMHYVGTDMVINLDRAAPRAEEPSSECLLQTPKWDFNWQRWYNYDAEDADLPVIREGDTLRLRCTYNNTLDNPGVQQALADAGLSAPNDVTLGEETLDEMCLGVFGIIY